MLLRAPAASSGQAIAASRKRLPNEAATRSGDTERIEKKNNSCSHPTKGQFALPLGCGSKGIFEGTASQTKIGEKKVAARHKQKLPLADKIVAASWIYKLAADARRLPEGCRKAAGRLPEGCRKAAILRAATYATSAASRKE